MSKGPGGKTPGDGASALRLRQIPPLHEALERPPDLFPVPGTRVPALEPRGDARRRLEKMVPSHDR